MITLYSGPLSLFSRKVEIALREKELPFNRVIVPFSQTKGYFDKPLEVVRINPKGQVPVLIDGEAELYDSTVIIEYLEDAYPRPSIMPATPAARSRMRQWDVFADEVMLAPNRKLMHRTEPRDHSSDSWRLLETAAADAAVHLATLFDGLDAALQVSRGYLCGTFSAADISCFMQVFWAQRLAGPPFGERHALRAWYDLLKTRPSFETMIAEVVKEDEHLSAPVLESYPDMPELHRL